MKINKLEKDETGKVVNIDIEMSDEESAFFIGFAFNNLMQQGIIRINEQNDLTFDIEKMDKVIEKTENTVVVADAPKVPQHGPVGVAPDLQ